MPIFRSLSKSSPPEGLINGDLCRFLFERSEDAVAVIQDARLKFANARLSNILGLNGGEPEVVPSSLLVSRSDLACLLGRNDRLRRGEENPPAGEVNIRHKDGRRVEAEISAERILFEGRPAEIVIVRVPATEKKGAGETAEPFGPFHESMGKTILALALTVESRDPVTAGHHRRVADLARKIAAKLGLPPKRAEAVRLAGSIHDLGKISIPSEILNKPGPLGPTELTLIRNHPQVGHDILHRIGLPWPIDEIVLQHHERMDGSGYPRRLKGGEIKIEARVLAVADVVEAMLAHRPFRTAHAESATLDEITRQRGVLYDADAVDACLRLFARQEYQLSR